jgi:hypothetical protein
MRAVALADKTVQEKVAKSFIPLKVKIDHGTEKFPLDWPGLKGWADVHRNMGGKKCEGITACSVISPDTKFEYANTGSAMVWEMFDSTAYDAKKFTTMLDRGVERWISEKKIREDKNLTEKERDGKLSAYRAEIRRAVAKEGSFQLPPKGFTIEGAIELFELSGDVKKK